MTEPAAGERGFVRVGALADFPAGAAVERRIGGRRIAIYREGDELFAIKNVCPHQGELLHRLPASEGEAVCVGHGWRFDLRTGACVRGDPEARVAVYAVEVRNGEVFVGIGAR